MKLESFHKPLDADIEKDDLEGIYRDNNQPSDEYLSSYNLLFDANDSYLGALLRGEIDDDDKDAWLEGENLDDEIRRQIAETEIYGAEDIGRYTINTPTEDKKRAEQQDYNMEPLSPEIFHEISDDADQVDIEMQAELERMATEIEKWF